MLPLGPSDATLPFTAVRVNLHSAQVLNNALRSIATTMQIGLGGGVVPGVVGATSVSLPGLLGTCAAKTLAMRRGTVQFASVDLPRCFPESCNHFGRWC